MQQTSKFSAFKAIPSTVWAVGFVGMLINISAVIVFTITPFYLTAQMGVTLLGLGYIEGFVEFIGWLTRLFSGMVSDYLHKRKPILFLAYGFITLSRFIFPIAPNATCILLAKFIDRIGNGLQATPREALVADVAPAHLKGACFGMRQTLSMFGSFFGAGLLIILLVMSDNNYKLGFIVAAIPPIIALIILAIYVKDKPTLAVSKTGRKKIFHLADIKKLSKQYWLVIGVSSLFMMANYSGTFMILQASNAGLAKFAIPVVMVLQNLAAFLCAFPVGRLSDKIGRNKLLMCGFILVIASNAFLSMAHSLILYLAGVIIWGVQMGINQSLLLAKVADNSPESVRGSAFGIYYVGIAVASGISNIAAGWISHTISLEMVFHASSGVVLLAFLGLFMVKDNPHSKVS